MLKPFKKLKSALRENEKAAESLIKKADKCNDKICHLKRPAFNT